MTKTEMNEILFEPMKGGGHYSGASKKNKTKRTSRSEKKSSIDLTKQLLINLQKIMTSMLPSNVQSNELKNTKPKSKSKTQKRSV
jgi:hypothetical protein